MAKKTLVNAETKKSVSAFINAVENKERQADSRALLKLIQDITKEKPKMWGQKIIGYGKYKYQRKNGEEFEWFNVGFSPGKAHLSVYLKYDLDTEPKLRGALGPHKKGRGCVYIKRLEDVDLAVLKTIIAKSN